MSANWFLPTVWAVFVLLAARTGRVGFAEALVSILIVILGYAVPRGIAPAGESVLGRASGFVLLGSALAAALGEPTVQRHLILVAGSAIAAALTITSRWERAQDQARRNFAMLVGMMSGLILGLGVQGAPNWHVKALFICAASTATAWLLTRVTTPFLAILTSVALGAAIGSTHTLAWVLPPVTIVALWSLRERRSGLIALCAIVCSAFPPAGVALSIALTAAAVRRSWSLAPLLALLPCGALAIWRTPASAQLIHAPSLEALELVFPTGFASLPLLLPVLLLALTSKSTSGGDARDAFGVGLLLLPVVSGGPYTATTAACLWLAALPSVPRDRDSVRHFGALAPWTIGASLASLLLAPLGGCGMIAVRPELLFGGLVIAMTLTRLSSPIFRIVVVLPVIGLLWTTPVAGPDQHLEAGDPLTLNDEVGVGPVLLVHAKHRDQLPAGHTLLRDPANATGGIAYGRDVPNGRPSRTGHLVQIHGTGRSSRAYFVGAIPLTESAPSLVATTDLIVWVESGERWFERSRRTHFLLLGCGLLIAAALATGTRKDLLLNSSSVTLLILAAVSAGGSVDPLSSTANRLLVDFAAAIWILSSLVLLRRLSHRKVLAGALVLLPLALTQPLLRGPAGDEVYHLKLAESLAEDQDLALSNNLDPDHRGEAIYIPHGDDLIHSPIPAITSLPGWLVAGHAGAAATMALLVALGIGLTAQRAARLGVSRRAVDAIWMLSLLSYPAVTFSASVWPAAFGVALVGIGLHFAGRGILSGSAVASLCALFVKVRLGLVLLPITLATAWSNGRRKLSSIVSLLALGVAISYLALGGPLGRHRIAELVPHSPGALVRAAWGLLWDGAGGLAFTSPLWLVALLGLAAVWKRGSNGERALIVGAGLTVVALLPRAEWFGGGSPPARYLVPLLPLAMLSLAECATTTRGRRWIRLALPWTGIAAWVAVTRPLYLFNSGDGGWWFVDGLARAFDGAARELLPTLLRSSTAAWVVPAMICTAAWIWTRRQRSWGSAFTLAGCCVLCALTAYGREPLVHAEDPQVTKHGGISHPPPNSFFPSAHGISWRLTDGTSITIPWRPPQGRSPVARVRVDDRQSGEGGRLSASWNCAPSVEVDLPPSDWRWIELPRPISLGRGKLTLGWNAGKADVLIDLVEVSR